MIWLRRLLSGMMGVYAVLDFGLAMAWLQLGEYRRAMRWIVSFFLIVVAFVCWMREHWWAGEFFLLISLEVDWFDDWFRRGRKKLGAAYRSVMTAVEASRFRREVAASV